MAAMIRRDVTLSTGLRVTHRRAKNGSTWALPSNRDYSMTREEWQEYCATIKSGAIGEREDNDPPWEHGGDCSPRD